MGLRLRAALIEAPSPALYAIAREVGVDVRELKRHYRAECRALAEAHATARGAAIEAKRASDLRRLRETIDALHAKGRRPSKWFVEQSLADVSLRDPILYQAWRDRMLELGWLQPGHRRTDVGTR